MRGGTRSRGLEAHRGGGQCSVLTAEGWKAGSRLGLLGSQEEVGLTLGRKEEFREGRRRMSLGINGAQLLNVCLQRDCFGQLSIEE